MEMVTTDPSIGDQIFEVVGNGDERKTGDIDRLEKIPLAGLVKRLESFGIIGKGDGMNNAVQATALFRPDLGCQSDPEP